MDTLTRWLSFILPGLAARRIASQARLALASRYYDAIAPSSHRPRRGSPVSADTTMDRAQGRVRDYGRWLDENHDLAVGVLDDMVTNIVGCGAGVEPMAVRVGTRETAAEMNRLLGSLWAEFWDSPETTGELPGVEVERLMCRSWLRDGEVFAQHVIGQASNSRIPYALELLESDFVPFDLTTPDSNLIHGVQKNAWGRPIGYWVCRTHPGNLRTGGGSRDVIWKPAEQMMHLKFARRLHQTRGVSVFHAVLTRLDDLKDYEESERIAARVAAAFTAYIKRGSDFDEQLVRAATAEDNAANKASRFEMEPGLIFNGLLPGEDVGIIDSKRPNPNLEAFRNAQLRGIASGTGSRFSSIAKNYNGTYSAQRQELVEGYLHYRRLFSYLRSCFYLPVWRRFIDASRLAGLLKIPADVDIASVYRPEIRPPMMPWIDPQKELTAYQIAVENGFRSRQQVIRDMGGDPAIVDAQIEADTLTLMAPVTESAPPTDQEEAA